MPGSAPVTVVETPEFLSAVRALMDEDERAALVNFLASNPTAGDLIKGTGGVRKLRWLLKDEASAAARASSISIIAPACPCFS